MFEGNHLAARVRAGSAGRENAVFAELRDGSTVTFGRLFDAAQRIAHVLAAAGAQPGDRVAAQVGKSIETLELYIGAVLAGCAFLPLNTAYTDSEIEYFLSDAEPVVFVCDPARLAAQEPLARRSGARAVFSLGGDGRGSLTEAASAESQRFDAVPRGPDDLAAILYTSGTTGRSKGAMLSHRNLESNSSTLVDLWGFSAEDRLIHALPIFHTHGLFVASNVALMAGASVLFFPKFDADAIVAAMPRATSMMGVPTFYTRLLDHPGLGDAARGMRLFISGSAPLLEETHQRWASVTGAAILERYGMTETNMIASNPYAGERRAGTVGFPLPGVAIRIAGTDGAPVADGGVGVIEVQGPNVFRGYWRMPEKTAEEFRDDGWFVTGDLGRIDERGYLSIVGRAKDLIISGGFNVYPKEVEAVIDALDGVVESAVIGLPHKDFGEGVAAVVVMEAGRALDEAAMLEAVRGALARFKQPKRLFAVEALPRNAMGKVQKAELRRIYRDAFAHASA